MRKSLFQINEGPVYIGYTNGYLWNGWATPYFTYEEAERLQAEINQRDDMRMFYESRADKFYWQHEDDDEPYVWKGEDIQTVDGIKHLYGIGAYSHIWDELGDEDKQYLAQNIAELVIEHDQEWYEDNFECGDDLVDYFIDVFDDIDTFYKAHTIMNDARLNCDEIYEKLSEVLHI